MKRTDYNGWQSYWVDRLVSLIFLILGLTIIVSVAVILWTLWEYLIQHLVQ